MARKISNEDNSMSKKAKKTDKMVDIEEVEKDIKNKLKKIEPLKRENKKEQNTFSLFEVVLLVIITILSCILIGYLVQPTKKTTVSVDIADKNIKKFAEQYKYILDNYYEEISGDKLVNEAIKGMLSSLDNYSEVIGTDSNFTVTLNGTYEGIGIVIANDVNGNIVVQGVYEDTPAARAGIKPGDIISYFNDMPLNGVPTSQLVTMIAASDGMELTILRNNEEMKVEVKRERIVLRSVNYQMLDNNIGYISVDIFALNTDAQFKEALDALESQNMKSLIIDLRSNTGGHLSTVENMLSMMMDKKHIVYQLQSKEGTVKKYSTGTQDKNYRIVILQNGVSASASEIMSASLKENLNAYIIGTNSFGKGTVQTIVDELKDFTYKVTTKKWLTPKGNWINGIGVEPDLTVNLSEAYYQNPGLNTDDQLQAAINYLK